MTHRTRKHLFLLALALLVLAVLVAGCADVYPYQPAMTRPVNGFIESRVIHVRWYEDADKLNNDCAAEAPVETSGRTFRILGCARMVRGQCYVRVLLPRDFNDEPRLELLGHEALHCYGARHGG